RGLNGTLAVESGLAQLPPSFLGTLGTVQNTGGRCTQQGQFRTRVVGAHSRDSSKHGWSVHTAGTVQNTGGLCAQQGQFRTRVVCAHNRDSSGHGGVQCTQQGQFRTRVVCAHTTGSSWLLGTLTVGDLQTLSSRRLPG
ncbi:unnamed protein product, partial [Staurois parvus]